MFLFTNANLVSNTTEVQPDLTLKEVMSDAHSNKGKLSHMLEAQ